MDNNVIKRLDELKKEIGIIIIVTMSWIFLSFQIWNMIN